MRLRLLRTPALDGATNMALDDALLGHARRSGDLVVRAYTWARPTLSFGRHQRARGVYAEERAAAHGIDIVRRPTGGRAVLHARELTYSVAARTDVLAISGAPLGAAYARITAMIADALDRLGVDVACATPPGRARRPDGAPCFDAPAAGELVATTPADPDSPPRKLVGSAQWREDGALLQHGSILIDDDQALLACCANAPLGPMTPPATLRELLGRPIAADETADALFSAADRLAAALGTTVDHASTECVDVDGLTSALDDPAIADEVARLLPRYCDPAWTWRR